MDNSMNWFNMSVTNQIANVGSEVNMAINWKNKGKKKRETSFCNKAIEFLELIKNDPKNKYRCNELDGCIEELRDYFLGENIYNTTDEMLKKYYDSFVQD